MTNDQSINLEKIYEKVEKLEERFNILCKNLENYTENPTIPRTSLYYYCYDNFKELSKKVDRLEKNLKLIVEAWSSIKWRQGNRKWSVLPEEVIKEVLDNEK